MRDQHRRGGLLLWTTPRWYECPFCLKPVGLVGRAIAVVLGTRAHNCQFTNVVPAVEAAAIKALKGDADE